MNQRKLPYEALPGGFRAKVKTLLNAVLKPAGLEIDSTLRQQIENARLQKLTTRGHWTDPKYTQALKIDRKTALDFLEETCGEYRTDYQTFPISQNGDSGQFFLQNGWFDAVDAELLYSVLRRFHPTNIVEVGSGFSTRVMRRAIRDGKLVTKITSIDPQPNTEIAPYADDYIKLPVEDVDVPTILALIENNGLLFIDSSHAATSGGDVPYLLLELIPRLPAGVLIHIHDIFFPFDYPSQWINDGWGWNEQYLVHAFLAYNNDFKILWPARFMWEYERDAIEKLIPSARRTAQVPSSLWIQKIS